MKSTFFRYTLVSSAVFYATAGLAAGAMAGTVHPQNVIEAARKTVESFDGSPHRTRFRAAIRRADAVVILPASPSTLERPTGEGRPALAVTYDSARGSWSNPAFYRLEASSGDLAVGSAGVMFIVTKTGAVRQLKEGSLQFGGTDGLKVTSVTTGVEPGIQINATADALAFVDVNEGQIGPSTFDQWRLTADTALNSVFYDRASTPESILSQGTVSMPGVDELIGGLRIAEGIGSSRP